MSNYRIFVEKHPEFQVEAKSLLGELNENLQLELKTLRDIGDDRRRLKDLDARVSRVLALKGKCGKLTRRDDLSVDPAAVDTKGTDALITTIEETLAAGR